MIMKRYLYIICITIYVLGCSTSCNKQFKLAEIDDIVMYQINPLVFAEEQSFKAVEAYIDSIKQLGANIVWFMPIHEKGLEKGVGSPYCVKDYYSVYSRYGTMDDFRQLIAAFHKKNIGVIIDWVPNHTSWDNPWMANIDWYTQDSLGNVVHPPGTSWRDVADLNFDNADMRLAMIDAMKFWVLDVGIDGFRCDAVDFVPADFLKQANDTLLRVTNHPLLLLAEGKREDHFQSGFDLNYGWDLTATMRRVFQRGASASDIYKTNMEEYAAIPEGKHKLRFITNHDETARRSPIDEWEGERGSMSAWVITAFLPGCPLIYSSQEVGHPSRIRFFDYVYVDWDANNHLRKEYEKTMAIYNAHEAFRKGELKTYPMDDVALFERRLGDKRYLIAANVRNSAQSVNLPAELANKSYSDLYAGSSLKLAQELTLEPFEYKILKIK